MNDDTGHEYTDGYNDGYSDCKKEREAENADLTKRLGQAHAALEQETNAHEDADREVMALLAALEEIKGRVQFGTSTHMSSDIVKMCDAALKEGKRDE